MDAAALAKYGIKPIIHEIVRTEVIFPRIVLLVEHTVIQDCGQSQSGADRQAFRLYLTDGEYRIQGMRAVSRSDAALNDPGVLRRRLHKTALQSDVGRGSVMILKDYKMAMAKRLKGKGSVL